MTANAYFSGLSGPCRRILPGTRKGLPAALPRAPAGSGNMRNTASVRKPIWKVVLTVFFLLLVLLAVLGVAAVTGLRGHIQNLSRIDGDGRLYYAEYTGEYETALIQFPARFLGRLGCSSFVSRDSGNGDVLTFRNYDLPHRDPAGAVTGLNVVLKLSPEGRYSSLNIADAAWFSLIGIPYCAGALDNGQTTLLPLAYLPYLCMDGINDQGLCVSILAVDRKEDEEKTCQREGGGQTVQITMLLRSCLDRCATVEQAVSLAESCRMQSLLGYEYHLFVTDMSGNSAVLEWRNNQLAVTYTDAVTNFYVGSDDGEDYYRSGVLRDACVRLEGLSRSYRYGYGHGYERFNKIVSALEKYRTDPSSGRTALSIQEGVDLLASVSQPYIPGLSTSYTQYSAVYNNTGLSVSVFPAMDYSESYTFRLS